ncbi:unnamed protein product [Rotaria sordida]|uniref:Uncharacterized protein n=1 Tax=Rotaria sordida TaxID=392033 RepID=A0A819RPR6_9BILA|nr:unnamed protein product [Rotaria sordida]CAF4098249.1 unnamed protein product [Rotaria sordida]
MAKNIGQYYILSFTTTGTCKSYDELEQWCLEDDCYQKLYPAIANNTLLEGLTEFVQNKNNHPEKSGIANSTIYRKANGRKIDSSRNYKLVREADGLDIFHLYVEITKGLNRGHFKMLTNSMEYAADKEKLFIARERCEFINRCVLANVAITIITTIILYDVTKLGPVSKSGTTRTEKPVVPTSKRLTKSSDGEEDDTETSLPKLIATNTRLTPKLDCLRPRAVGAGDKDLASNFYTLSTSSSSGGKKRKQDEIDDNNMKQSPKKKKSRHAESDILDLLLLICMPY